MDPKPRYVQEGTPHGTGKHLPGGDLRPSRRRTGEDRDGPRVSSEVGEHHTVFGMGVGS